MQFKHGKIEATITNERFPKHFMRFCQNEIPSEMDAIRWACFWTGRKISNHTQKHTTIFSYSEHSSPNQDDETANCTSNRWMNAMEMGSGNGMEWNAMTFTFSHISILHAYILEAFEHKTSDRYETHDIPTHVCATLSRSHSVFSFLSLCRCFLIFTLFKTYHKIKQGTAQLSSVWLTDCSTIS